MESQAIDDVELIGTSPRFYSSFIELTNSTDSLDVEVTEKMSDTGFRNHIQSMTLDYRLVRELAPYIKRVVIKPQRLLVDMEKCYVAIDLLTNTYYACFKELIMIDIDSYRDTPNLPIEKMLPHCLCQIESTMTITSSTPEKRTARWTRFNCGRDAQERDKCTLRYRIFKSGGGFHAFVISHRLSFRDPMAVQLMCESMGDYFYILFSYLRGCCVRLNRKRSDVGDIYSYYGDVVRGSLHDRRFVSPSHVEDLDSLEELEELEDLVDLHIELANRVFKDAEPVISTHTQSQHASTSSSTPEVEI